MYISTYLKDLKQQRNETQSLYVPVRTQWYRMVICSVTHFRNRVPGCNYQGTQTVVDPGFAKGGWTMASA